MKNKKKLSIWIYIPEGSKSQFDPLKSTLTKVIVKCTFKKIVHRGNVHLVEYEYIHPRLNKKLIGTTFKYLW